MGYTYAASSAAPRKPMGTGMKALIATLAIVGVIVFALAGSFISAKNYGARTEASLRAAYADMDNVLGNFSNKVLEVSQVSVMYRDDVKEIFKSSIEARYGGEGSHAMFQFLKEHNPNIDAKVYTQIQQVIESGRDQFTNSQRMMLDIKRGYEASLGTFWTGLWLGISGYPKEDLSTYKQISSEFSQEAFKAGKSGPIKLR